MDPQGSVAEQAAGKHCVSILGLPLNSDRLIEAADHCPNGTPGPDKHDANPDMSRGPGHPRLRRFSSSSAF